MVYEKIEIDASTFIFKKSNQNQSVSWFVLEEVNFSDDSGQYRSGIESPRGALAVLRTKALNQTEGHLLHRKVFQLFFNKI